MEDNLYHNQSLVKLSNSSSSWGVEWAEKTSLEKMFEIKKIKFGFTLINLLSQDATQGH
jgi:hypothetical protein